MRHFKPPVPAREISIVTYRHFVKQRIIEVLREEICKSVPKEMISGKRKQVTQIEN